MRRRILALSLSLLTLGGAASAEAQAPPRSILPADLLDAAVGAPVAQEPGFHTGFGIDPPGPYEVRVRTDGAAVTVSVMRGNRRERVAVTNYLARGVAQPERLQASFGKLGRISMRFRESRHRTWFGKRRRCRGADRFVVRRGVFIGNFRFDGEGGYLKLRSHRARGSVSSVAGKCQRKSQRRRERDSSIFEDSFAGLIATDRAGVAATVFGAISFGGRLFQIAQREENRGRLAILRTAIVRGRGELPLNESATVARFSPGAPFHGAGRYRAAPDGSTTWSGNLSVDFPGAPKFPLTGPGYETFLEAGL